MRWHLAQLNIGRLRAPLDAPETREFIDNLVAVNTLAESSPGYVWRLQTEDGDATSIRAFEDELMIVNLTTWQSVEQLADYVYRSGHVEFLRRKREWFERYGSAYLVLWWIPAGHEPTVDEALDRLARLEAQGPSPDAFTFRQRYGPLGDQHSADDPARHVEAGADDVCPV